MPPPMDPTLTQTPDLNTVLITSGDETENCNQPRQAMATLRLKWTLMDFTISVKCYNLEPNQ